MSCSSKGRSYRKFYDAIPKIPETLQTVTERGNTSTQSVEFEGDVETQGFFIGDGSQLTNIPPQSSITLETTVDNSNTATRGAYFDGDLEATGFLIGDGSQLQNLPAAPNITLQTVVANDNVASRGAYFTGDLEASGYLIGDGTFIQNLPTPTLDAVLLNDNVATQGAYFTGDVEASGYLIGDGSQLQNLPAPTLQQVTSQDAVTNDKITFSNLVTSLETSGNVVVNGNVTALEFFGDGSELTSIVPQSQLDDNSSRINTLNQKVIITNTNGITTNFTKGDILYASSIGTLSKLAISSTQGHVLTVNASGVPTWGASPSVSSLDNRISSLEGNLMVTSTTGITGFTTGDILYASGTNTLTRLPKGAAGQFLAINSSGIPDWVNGPGASTQFITESYTSIREARLGFHNTNPQHMISFGTSYYDENTGDASGNLVINGNVYAEFYYGDGVGLTNVNMSQTSDARAKSNTEIIVNSLDTLSKLKPVVYDKDGLEESGFIAQDIYYDAPELRHLVQLGKDANPNETKNEPNYEDWGEEHAKLDYVGLIAYTVAAINELREMVEDLENA
tara:strand:+ start:257 stop:1951 length:1695 start_codon:yes stop_codon:yes gene_type:complete